MVDLAYFIGRPFKELVKGDYKGKNVTRWEIHLDSGGIIANKDAHVALPDEDLLAGTTFIRPIYSELDTRLQFGVKDAVAYEIILNPVKYTISDPTFLMEEGEIYPQVVPEMQTPPDPSDERVAEGPEEDEMEAEEGTQEGTESGDDEGTEEGTETGTEGGDEDESADTEEASS